MKTIGKVMAVLMAVLVLEIALLLFYYTFFVPSRGDVVIGNYMQLRKNMKQIRDGLLAYEKEYSHFPPCYTTDSNGNRLHSWRTLILPYIGESKLYDSIRLNEPWNSKHNLALTNRKIKVFSDPRLPSFQERTTFLSIDQENGIFNSNKPTAIRDITDGMTDTLLFFRVKGKDAIPWADPSDPTITSFPDEESGLVMMADGSFDYVHDIPRKYLEALNSKNGDDTVPNPYLESRSL